MPRVLNAAGDREMSGFLPHVKDTAFSHGLPGTPGDLDYLGVRSFLYEVVTLISQVSPGGSGPVAGWRHARGMTDSFLVTPGYRGDQGQAGT